MGTLAALLGVVLAGIGGTEGDIFEVLLCMFCMGICVGIVSLRKGCKASGFIGVSR